MGETLTTAQSDAAKAGVKLQFQFKPNDTTQPDNTVIQQNPPAGSQMQRDDTITVTVVNGQPTVVVPNLTGLAEADALNALTQAGLQAGVRSTQFDPSIASGQVVSSNPRAGVPVQKGTTVDYVVSMGPSPTPEPDPDPHADAYSHPDSEPDTQSDSNSGAHAHARPDRRSDPRAHADPYAGSVAAWPQAFGV